MSVLDFLGFGGQASAVGESAWYPSLWGRRTTAGIDVNEVTANNYSAVWAATRVLSATGSHLPLNLMESDGKYRKVAKGHSVQKLLRFGPSSALGSMAFRTTCWEWLLNWGNAYAEIVRDHAGQVVDLHLIHPSRVTIKRDDDTGEIFYRVNCGAEPEVDIAKGDMFHVRSIKSFDGINGVGIISCARESVGFGLAVEKQGAAYFKNGGRPTVIISGGKFKNDEAREWYRQQFMEVHGGPENNGKPLLLPTDATADKLQFSAEDSQFLQTREHNVEVIARWYGVPPHMIGDLRRATFSNIEHLAIEFVTYSLMPWLRMFEEEIALKLLTERERETHYAKHNVEALLRGDSAARAEFYTALYMLSAISPNEIREFEDKNPIEGGDVYYRQLNMTPLGEDPEPEPVVSNEPESDAMAKLLAYMEQNTPEVEAPNVAEQWLVADFQRATAKERKDINRAANKEKNFLGWMDAYYDKYEPQLCDAIASAAKAANVNRFEIAAEHCRQSKEQLLTAAEVPAEEFTSKVQALTAEWESRQPLELNNVA